MTRERLRNRRLPEVLEFQAMGMRLTGSVSRYPDGRPGEIFIDNHKAGSGVATLARDMAIAVSFRPATRCRRRRDRRALCRDSDGQPLSPLGVLLDLIAGDSA